jgi:hypothetical protein
MGGFSGWGESDWCRVIHWLIFGQKCVRVKALKITIFISKVYCKLRRTNDASNRASLGQLEVFYLPDFGQRKSLH